MFSARKLLEPPSKRTNAYLAATNSGDHHVRSGGDYDVTGEGTTSKRPRLHHRRAPTPTRTTSLDDIENDHVLVETPECAITRVRALPAYLCEEIRRERPTGEQMVHCRVSVAVTNEQMTRSASSRGDRIALSYYVLALRTRVVLWQEGSGSIVALPLPDELHERPDDRLYPFLFSLYGSRVSLMIISQSGAVLFWEDIDLPYESVPLSVQIPLQSDEQLHTHGNAGIVVSQTESDELKSILCWSNQGNVWEVAMEDRRIRVRSFERQQGGFLSGLTKTVSSFFFTSNTPEIDTNQPITAVKIIPSSADMDANNNRDDDNSDSVDMLVLFANGTIERRSFNAIDVMDCASVTQWHFDANRVAISYFSENFPSFHLAKVSMVSIPYINDHGFGLLIAYVCTAGDDTVPTVKYALLHFRSTAGATRNRSAPEPDWACLLDYEPEFSETASSDKYFTVHTLMATSSALYLVWPKSQPMHFTSIQLPAAGQSSVRSRGFSLKGIDRNSVYAFGSRVEASTATMGALKGSVSFVVVDFDQTPNGIVCSATASNMVSLERPRQEDLESRRKRVDEVNRPCADSHVLPENLSVQEYARLLMVHFEEDSSNGLLRVASRDIANVAQGALAVACQILDTKASSGLRWGKEAHQQVNVSNASTSETSYVTPKLVRYQLEEKRSRHEAFVIFLKNRCEDVWRFCEETQDYLRYLSEGEEKLHAAISLCKFQATLVSTDSTSGLQPKVSGELLLRAIERTVEQRGYQKEQLRLAGYNAFDIFYCEVSKIGELFVNLRGEVQQLAASEGEGNSAFLYGLLESGYSMQSLLKTVPSTQLVSTGSWMFTRQIREVIADQIARLSAAVGYSVPSSHARVPWSAQQVFQMSEQLRKLGTVLLDAYGRFLPSSSGEVADDLTKEVDITKRLVLNALVYVATDYEARDRDGIFDEDGWAERQQTELFAAAVELAETHLYYEAMVHLAFKEDEENLAKLDYVTGRIAKSAAANRIETYCREHTDFADFLFRWYGGEERYPWSFDGDVAQSQMFAFLVYNSTVFNPSLHAYLKSHPVLYRYCWLTAISSEKYDHVAALTLHEAKSEQVSCTKRKTMASIAKIAALAAPDSSRHRGTVTEVKRELTSSRIQDVLSQLPLDLRMTSRPMEARALVHKSLEALSLIALDDPLRTSLFLMAVEAVECLPLDLSDGDFEDACVEVWQQCILNDHELWADILEEFNASVNEERVETLMRQTLLFSSMVKYVARFAQRGSVGNRSARLTVEIVDNMVQRELSTESIICVATRQLFVKTLNLALAP